MSRKKICVFACGGHGSRMGAELPKQFLRVGDKTILQISIEKMIEAVPDVHIVLVLPSEYVSYWKQECSRQHFRIPQSIVDGGITRFHSVKNALSKLPDDAIVAVHDAVRPLVSVELVRRLFTLAEEHPAVVPVVPVIDTLKVLQKDENGILRTIQGAKADRSVLFGAQTPQLFWSETLKSAYKLPYDTLFTDDASVVEASGVEVFYTEGERYNIKVTTPEDMLFLGRFL